MRIGSRVITAGFVVFILLVVLYSLLSPLLDGVRECDELVALKLVSVWLLQQPELEDYCNGLRTGDTVLVWKKNQYQQFLNK